MISRMSCILITFIMFFGFGSIMGVNAQKITNFEFEDLDVNDFNIDDFIEYEVYESYGDPDHKLTGHIRIEFTEEKTVTVEGNDHNCKIARLKGVLQEDYYGNIANWDISGKIYIDKSTGAPVKGTYTFNQEGNTAAEATDFTRVYISVVSNLTGTKDPGIGDSWKLTISKKSTYEYDVNTVPGNTITRDIIYEYLRDIEVKTDTGTFNCRVIKSYEDVSESKKFDIYDLHYIDNKNEIPVKLEHYEQDKLVTNFEIIAYQIDGNSGGTPVIGTVFDEKEDADKDTESNLILIIAAVIVIVVVLIIILVIVKGKKKSEKKAVPQSSTTQMPQTTPQVVVQPQAPQPTPQAPSTYTGGYTCSNCSGQLEYLNTEQRWYCRNCNKYQ